MPPRSIVVNGRVAYSYKGVARFFRICERTLWTRLAERRVPPADLTYAGARYWWRDTLEGLNLRRPTAKAELLVAREPGPTRLEHTPVMTEPDA
jgi:hypothetical protein